MNQRYLRPPITEAIIEVKFGEQVDRDAIDKVRSKLTDVYAISEPFNVVGVHFDIAQRSTKFQEEATGFKLSTQDRTGVVIGTTKYIATSRLAPYSGWDDLYGRAQSNWSVWKRVVGYKKVQRIGVRYVNRIDIPTPSESAGIRLEEYLTFYPESPEGVVPFMSNFTMQIQAPLGEDNCNLLLNMAAVSSPVPMHHSFLFDLDVSREGDVPQNDDELWSLINSVRKHKNRVFEAAVTDKARALFQ